MRQTRQSDQSYQWIVYAVAVLLVGAIVGYVLSTPAGPTAPAQTTSTPPAGQSPAPISNTAVVDEAELKAYRDILARDPKNIQAAIKAGNMLYDAKRYAEAVPFYQQAFALNAKDINVSTDLGTALWYSGRADEALAQYDKSLAIDASHQQTLFNIGIVKSEGKKDDAGALAVWQRLLKEHPDYPDVEHLRSVIAEAQKRVGTAGR